MNIPNVGEDEEQLKGSYTARVLIKIHNLGNVWHYPLKMNTKDHLGLSVAEWHI